MKIFSIAAIGLLVLAGSAAAEVKTASTPSNPALALAPPPPDAGQAATQRSAHTRTAAVGPNAADPSRAVLPQPGAAPAVQAPAAHRGHGNAGKPDVSIACVPGELKSVLREIERRWGDVQIISANRPGATIRNTGHPSKHATCQAVDFKPPPGTYNAVAKWLKATHNGGVGTYSGHFHHIHIDTGAKLTWHN